MNATASSVARSRSPPAQGAARDAKSDSNADSVTGSPSPYNTAFSCRRRHAVGGENSDAGRRSPCHAVPDRSCGSAIRALVNYCAGICEQRRETMCGESRDALAIAPRGNRLPAATSARVLEKPRTPGSNLQLGELGRPVIEVFRNEHPRLHDWIKKPAPDLDVARIREEALFARLVGKPKDEHPIDLRAAVFAAQHAPDLEVVAKRATSILEERSHLLPILRVRLLIHHQQSHGHFI